MSSFLNELWIARYPLLGGLLQTIGTSAASIVLGTLLGIVVGLLLVYAPRFARWICRIYIDIMRGTPVLVLIFAAFYMPSVIGLKLGAVPAGIIALTFFCGAHVAEILRGALQSIPRGQTEGARSIGLTFPQTLSYVLLPQAMRSILPTWINTAVEIVKASTLLSAIGVGEIMLKAQEIISRNFMSMQFYLFAGAIYLILNFGIERFGKAIERRVAFR